MDFSKMSGPELVKIWNEMVLTAVDVGIPVNSVKKFADQKSGIARCTKLHAQIQATKIGEVKDDLSIPDFLKRKPGDRPAAAPTTATATVAPNHKSRDWRIPKGMSDEEGAAMLARQQEGKKAKAAERIEKLKETKVARDAEKLAQVNAKREAKGLTVITSLTRKPKVNKQETDMAKAKKGAKAKSANGSWTSNDAVITRLAKGDEYEPRKGTIAARSWEATKAKTYAKFKELKGNPAYLRWFVSHGYVKVTG
jgi:hypothetical protein